MTGTELEAEDTGVLVSARPFCKAVGGKGRILPLLLPLLPPGVDQMRHIEPFVGGGAMFFARRPREAVLSDVNTGLMTAYGQIRDNTDALIVLLWQLAGDCSSDAYYEAREIYNTLDGEPTLRAALFIYLNKLCFNGLHRVNRKGKFNVPYGKYKNPKIFDETAIRAVAAGLQRAQLLCCDFTYTAELAQSGDFVYFDPPYEPLTKTANFTAYTAGGFNQDNQRVLRSTFNGLARRGCYAMLSNSDTPFIRELYSGFRIDTIQAPRAVSCKGDGRKSVGELIIRNYE